MDRTEELRKLLPERETPAPKSECSEDVLSAMRCSGELKEALDQYSMQLDAVRQSDLDRLEKGIGSAMGKGLEIIDLLEEMEGAGDELEFAEGIKVALMALIKSVEMKLEIRKQKTKRRFLNIALEPERPAQPRAERPQQPRMAQLLQEESASILESAQFMDTEVTRARKRISEIDKLQKLINHEIFSQDERIDLVLHKTGGSVVDVKISKNYLKKGREGKKVVRRFIAIMILIFAIVLLILHFARR